MKKLLLLFLLLATPSYGQLVISANLSGVVNAPIDQNGWQSFKVNLTQNITFNFVILPTGTPPPAQTILRVIFTQDATGGRTVTFASNIFSPCTVTATANATTICQFGFDGTSNTWIGISGGSGGGSATPGVFNSSFDPPLFQNYTLTTTGAQTGINLTANPIDVHTLSWRPSGTVTTCSIQLDTSPDNITYTAAAAIPSTTCTSPGELNSGQLVIANYVRVNLTVLTGGGTLTVVYSGRFAPSPSLGNGPGAIPTATSGLPSVIQWVEGTGGSQTISPIINTTAGDTLIVFGRSTSASMVAPTDTQGNTWSTVSNSAGCTIGGFIFGVFLASGIVGGPDTITFGAATNDTLGLAEVTPALLDAVSACATGTSTSPTTASVTTTNASDLLIMPGEMAGGNFSSTYPVQSGDPISANGLMAAFQSVQATGSYTLSGTLSSSVTWAAVVAALKGNPPTINNSSPTVNFGTATSLGTLTSGNQVLQFAVRANSQLYSTGLLSINVSGTITSVWPVTSSSNCAGLTCGVPIYNPPAFILEASTDGGVSWEQVPGLSKDVNSNPSAQSGPPAVFAGQYDLRGLSGAWFRFSFTGGYSANLTVTAVLG